MLSDIVFNILEAVTFVLALANLPLIFEDMSKPFVKIMRISMIVAFVIDTVVFILFVM